MSTNGHRTPADGGSDLSVVIVGAGFGGIAAAIELRRHGFNDITILEAAPRLGGTWLHNTYPGAACDVPSHLYSFSFAQRRDWSRLCSGQGEILGYLEGVARDHGVEGLVVCDTRVTACAWDDERAQWSVATAQGHSYAADAIVIATGQLHQPAHPRIPGIETFAGPSFHSARWDHEVPLAGRRVAVVGTGASAVQFIPEVAEQAAKLTVFQRTGNWFLPRRNRLYPRAIRTLIERVPGVQALRRRFMFQYCEALTLAIRHPATVGRLLKLRSIAFMRWQLRDDRELRRKVWPDYTFGCKRILFSSAFLPALQRPNVELVTEAVTAVRADGVVAADGALHEADVLIYGTGFKTNDFMFPMEVTGREGRSLRDDWAAGAHAHLGMTVPGYPSMFILYGPNTNTSGGSIIAYLEAQAAYVRQALGLLRSSGSRAIEVRPEVEAASDAETQQRFQGTAWTRCDSWYRDEAGRMVANWPGYMRDYLQATRELDPAHYVLTPALRPATASA